MASTSEWQYTIDPATHLIWTLGQEREILCYCTAGLNALSSASSPARLVTLNILHCSFDNKQTPLQTKASLKESLDTAKWPVEDPRVHRLKRQWMRLARQNPSALLCDDRMAWTTAWIVENV